MNDDLFVYAKTSCAYLYVWGDDVQRNISGVSNGVLSAWLINAGTTRTYGAEAEIVAIPWTSENQPSAALISASS